MEHPHSFTSSLLTQPPISAANQNAGPTSHQDHSEFWALYKPAQSDPRQDLTDNHSRDNISGFGLSSPALKQPSTKPFSGLPSRPQLTSPHREAGEAYRERLGIVYPRRPPRHAAASRSRLARSCRLRETNQTTHGIGHRAGRREFPDTRTTPAPVPQTPPQSLYGRIPAIQALASTRLLV